MSASQLARELPPHWETPEVSPGRLLTIGHSSHPLTTFLDLLQQHAVEVLVDTRSQPYSRYVPHFNARPLRQALLQTGIQYLELGHQLGGRPRDPALYDDRGRVDDDLLAASRPSRPAWNASAAAWPISGWRSSAARKTRTAATAVA